MFSEGDADRLYPAPLNALGCPPGPSKEKLYEGRRLVLVRLVWRTHTEIRPGVALHSDQGRVQVEWSPLAVGRFGTPGLPRRTCVRA